MVNLTIIFWLFASLLFFLSKFYKSSTQLSIIALNTSLVLYLGAGAIIFSISNNLAMLALGVLALFKSLTVLRVLVDNYKRQYSRSYNDMILLHFVAFIAFIGLWLPIDFTSAAVYTVMRIISLILAFFLFANIIINSLRFRYEKTDTDVAYKPSVSLLIPARNERHALEDSLKSALAIDYDKLEIIVMDDESQDDTPEIIKSFAHDGIRFIEGGPLPDGWIGKNYALQRLASEASGSILVFCDVDTRLEPQTLQRIINVFKDNWISMVSVFPKRHHVNYAHFFVQTLEALRKLATPYWLVPSLSPASSACWALRKSVLREMNDFKPIRSSLAPHYYFSRELAKSKQRFFFADFNLPVSIRKRISSEIESRVRRFYPGVEGSFLNVFFMTIFALFVLFPYLDIAFRFQATSISLISLITAGIFLISHLISLTKISPASWYMGIINFIPSIVLEIIILYTSSVMYEFRSVKWKDRTLPTSYVLQSPR